MAETKQLESLEARKLEGLIRNEDNKLRR